MELEGHQKVTFRSMWVLRHKPIVRRLGGFVHPKDELKKMIKELRRIKEA